MTGRRRLVLALSFALLGLFAVVLGSSINLRTDLSFVFPRSPTPETELLADRLQRGPASGVILLGLSGAAPATLAGTADELAEILIASGRFRFVSFGRFDPSGPEFEFLFDNRYLLNPAVSAQDFHETALRRELERRLQALATSAGMAGKDLLPADPTGRLPAIAAAWSGGSGQARGAGLWMSRDQTTALMMLHSKVPAFDLAAQETTLAFLRATFDGLNRDGRLRLDLAGPSVFATATSRLIRKDILVLTLSSTALVIALLFVAFRSVPLLLALVLPLGFGVCAGTAVVQLVFGQVHGITLGFGGTLIGVAVDYPIHLISHATEQRQARPAIEKIWRTLRLGVLTTVAAFLPFTLSSFPGLSQLGLFTIAGLLAAVLTTRWLLPIVLPPAPADLSSALWDRLRSVAGRAARLRLPLLAAALVAAIYLGTRDATIWETDLRNLSPTPAAARDLDRRLRQDLGAADVRYLLAVRGATPDAVLQAEEALAGDLAALVSAGVASGFDSAARYLPSLGVQQERRQALPDRAALRAAIERASDGLPFREGTFEPFLHGVEQAKAGAPLTMQSLRDAGLAWRLEPLIFQQGGDWVGLVVPRGVTDPGGLRDFVDRRQNQALTYLDLKEGSESLVADFRREALEWLAVGAATAVVLLFLGLRSVRRAFAVITPIALAILLTATILSLSGIAFSLFHLLAMLLVAGVGLDYALFFERHMADRGDGQRTLRANCLCAATSVSVFNILAFSDIPVLHGIGVTVAVGVALSLFFAFVFTVSGAVGEP